MNLKRAFIIAMAACVLPGAAMAQDDVQEVDARIIVTKNFTDGNPASVMVNLECNDGFVSQDGMADITDDGIGHTFIISGLTDLETVVCVVTEGMESGYTASYVAVGAQGQIETDTSCSFVRPFGEDSVPRGSVLMGLINTCAITNRPDNAEITVSKDWDITNSGGNKVNFYAEIDVTSPRKIIGGNKCGDGDWCKTLTFEGENPADQTVEVRTTYRGVTVELEEDNVDSYVEVENDCGGSVTVMPGETSESCAFTNSIFFEGIPTLSQYGMAIMALLMLGVGFVGFRRFI